MTTHDRKDLCPLCQRPNLCGMSGGGSTCWCVHVVIPPKVLRAILPELRNEACLCKACAAGAASRASPAAEQTDATAGTPIRPGNIE